MFNLAVFKMLLFECRLVLPPAQRGTGSERLQDFSKIFMSIYI